MGFPTFVPSIKSYTREQVTVVIARIVQKTEMGRIVKDAKRITTKDTKMSAYPAIAML